MGYTIAHITTASLSEQKDIEELLKQLNLDDEDIHAEQFYVCRTDEGLLGVGRIREHRDCLELCSLGVVQPHRGQGIGKALVQALLKDRNQAVYLVTEIPEFFSKLGFKPSSDYISSLIEKQKICREKLACKQPEIMVKGIQYEIR